MITFISAPELMQATNNRLIRAAIPNAIQLRNPNRLNSLLDFFLRLRLTLKIAFAKQHVAVVHQLGSRFVP
ncbi:MAG: hypothetical protein JWN40_680 [Phycisphaerales bacterium]|nr:hypothetical protein [Phycisphaerales bacterium]